MRETRETLLDFFGPQFEVDHPEGCTCPPPQLLQVEYSSFNFYGIINQRCSFCGLKIHAREMTYNKEAYPELTGQKLQEAISLIKPQNDIPIQFELSFSTKHKLEEKLGPATTLQQSISMYAGIPIIVDTNLPDDVIVFVYKTPQGERRELNVINLE